MFSIAAALSCMLWPGLNPKPLLLSHDVALQPGQTTVISYQVGRHFGRLLLPDVRPGIDIHAAEADGTAYISLTNHETHAVTLVATTPIARLVPGQCTDITDEA